MYGNGYGYKTVRGEKGMSENDLDNKREICSGNEDIEEKSGGGEDS